MFYRLIVAAEPPLHRGQGLDDFRTARSQLLRFRELLVRAREVGAGVTSIARDTARTEYNRSTLGFFIADFGCGGGDRSGLPKVTTIRILRKDGCPRCQTYH